MFYIPLRFSKTGSVTFGIETASETIHIEVQDGKDKFCYFCVFYTETHLLIDTEKYICKRNVETGKIVTFYLHCVVLQNCLLNF